MRTPPFMSALCAAGAAGYVFTNAEAAALVARMAVQPNNARKALIDTFVGSLKLGAISGANIWARLDILHVMAAHTEQAGLLDWKGTGPGTYDGVKNGAPTFTVDRGYLPLVSGDYIETNYNPTTLSLGFAQDDAHYLAYVTTAGAGGTVGDTAQKGNGNRISGKNPPIGTINAGAAAIATGPAGAAPHCVMVTRPAPASILCYRNGIAGVDPGAASVGLSGFSTIYGGTSAAIQSDRQIAIGSAGRSFTANMALDFYNAAFIYLTGVGSPA